MGRKLFVDDLRECPNGYVCARNFTEVVNAYQNFSEFDVVDLDYDLGERDTGLDILKWMCKSLKNPNRINIHSSHIEGRRLMCEYAEDNFPQSLVTTNNLF